MRQTMIDIAAQVTQYMTPVAYVGGVLLFVGFLAFLIWVVTHRGTGLLRLTGRLLILLGVFFLVSQIAAMALGLDPSVDFREAWFEINSKPFWLIGLVLFFPGFLMRIVGALRPTH
jgi:hypothetical protein